MMVVSSWYEAASEYVARRGKSVCPLARYQFFSFFSTSRRYRAALLCFGLIFNACCQVLFARVYRLSLK